MYRHTPPQHASEFAPSQTYINTQICISICITHRYIYISIDTHLLSALLSSRTVKHLYIVRYAYLHVYEYTNEYRYIHTFINWYTPPQCAAEFAQSQSPRTPLGKFLKSQLTTINPMYHGYTPESGDFLLPSSWIQNPTDTAAYTFSKISSHAILRRKLSVGGKDS